MGVIFNPKTILQIVDLQRELFEPEIEINLHYDFPKMREGSKAVWNFSENPYVLEASPDPN